ncbi:ABC transporter permease [Nonomuraea sp. KC401]|uniref:ABC transporter permease n=1 Tax=unclassified Nonomuraea TaxID=2593643 RepID=UPI0010FD1312|nr:ABC transporter permease [Nonomuraea sp. KC401]NBE99714.1 ABC transporter permease [Nonomuraea sp. K271]TLF56402.1 ABC transporter permease [Nonomuraea sp. KC401]
MTTTTVPSAFAPSARMLVVLRNALLPILLAAEVIFFTVAAPGFLSAANLANVVINSADLALLAAGVTLVVLLAGIDVSVGPMLGVVAWVGATLFVAGMPPPLVVVIALLLGGALGAVNGALVVGGRISPIITTLGTAAIFKTVLFILWDSTDVFAGPVVPALGPARAGGLPLVGLVVLAVFGVLAYVLRHRVFGRRLFAIGNDAEGARLLGVPVGRTAFAAYVLVGVLVGLAALIYVGRVGVVQATAGNELTLPAIAAVVVGGTSILGGEGGVLRTLGGLAFIALLQNGVVLMGVPPLWNGVLVGAAVALAVAFDVLTRRTLDKRIGARK